MKTNNLMLVLIVASFVQFAALMIAKVTSVNIHLNTDDNKGGEQQVLFWYKDGAEKWQACDVKISQYTEILKVKDTANFKTLAGDLIPLKNIAKAVTSTAKDIGTAFSTTYTKENHESCKVSEDYKLIEDTVDHNNRLAI